MVNKRFKDRLFCKLFGDEANKDNALSLYNALCNTVHTNIDELIIYTIEDVVYVGMKNDVAILLDSDLSLWEQQSTFNPNMPLRGLMYFGKMYDKYIESSKLNIYSSKLIKIPTPQYKVFYNGDALQPERTKLRLSDAFINRTNLGEFEWTADAINLNKGFNKELLDKCRPLRDYTTFVNKVKELAVSTDFEQAIDNAVDYCIDNDVLKDYLIQNRAEVKDMCLTEFNEKLYEESIRSEGYEQGREEGFEQGKEKGREQGVLQNLISLAKKGFITTSIAANEIGVPENDFIKLMESQK